MMKEVSIANQPSWMLENETMTVYLAKLGGHMAPVVFDQKSSHPIRPYHVNPWYGENLKLETPVEIPLRGDFFCMPFGENSPFSHEGHPLHGETATATWQFESESVQNGVSALSVSLDTQVRPGKVVKTISIKEGQNVLYIQDRIHDFVGEMTMGHHATLSGEHHWKISTSPLLIGYNIVDSGEPYAGKAYSALQSGETFTDFSRVPTRWKTPDTTDISEFPAREGFVDITQVIFDPSVAVAWTAAVDAHDGFLWFSLKDPKVLSTMTMWMENYGRHGSPWNGRNCCIGLEDVCAYLGEGKGLTAVEDVIRQHGVVTRQYLTADKPFDVNYIEGVVRVPEGFSEVASVAFGDDEVTFVSPSGQRVTASVEVDFLKSGAIV